jgi:phosphoglucomutase
MTTVACLALVSSSASIDAFVPKRSVAIHRSLGNSIELHASTSSASTILEIPTRPIAGMKPGTSGLRKKVEVWQAIDPSNKHYVENFIQSLLDTATSKNDGKVPQTYVFLIFNVLKIPVCHALASYVWIASLNFTLTN